MSILIQGMNLDTFLRVNNINPTDYLPLYGKTANYYGCKCVEFSESFTRPLVTETVPEIKQTIINPPATVIIWKDGTKTVSKTKAPVADHIVLPDGQKLAVTPKNEFDPEVGVAMCIAKKYFGSRNQFTKAVKGAMKDFEKRTWG